MKYWSAFAIAFSIAVVLSIWQFSLNAPVLSYGDPTKTYFKPATASPGDKIELCFDEVFWYKVCPSQLNMYLQPAAGHRKDFPTYNISTPTAPGKVPPKCRPFVVPGVDEDQYGMAKLYGNAKHYCLITTGTALPEVKLDIIKR